MRTKTEDKMKKTIRDIGVNVDGLVRQNFQLGEKVFYVWSNPTGKTYHEIKEKKQEVIGLVKITGVKLSYGKTYYSFSGWGNMSEARIFRNEKDAATYASILNDRKPCDRHA